MLLLSLIYCKHGLLEWCDEQIMYPVRTVLKIHSRLNRVNIILPIVIIFCFSLTERMFGCFYSGLQINKMQVQIVCIQWWKYIISSQILITCFYWEIIYGKLSQKTSIISCKEKLEECISSFPESNLLWYYSVLHYLLTDDWGLSIISCIQTDRYLLFLPDEIQIVSCWQGNE